MAEIGFDFSRAHFSGVFFAVEIDVAFDPADIGFFRSERVVLHAYDGADLVEQFGCRFGIGRFHFGS